MQKMKKKKDDRECGLFGLEERNKKGDGLCTSQYTYNSSIKMRLENDIQR